MWTLHSDVLSVTKSSVSNDLQDYVIIQASAFAQVIWTHVQKYLAKIVLNLLALFYNFSKKNCQFHFVTHLAKRDFNKTEKNIEKTTSAWNCMVMEPVLLSTILKFLHFFPTSLQAKTTGISKLLMIRMVPSFKQATKYIF